MIMSPTNITRHQNEEPEHEINLRMRLSSSLYYEAQIMTNRAVPNILSILLVIGAQFYKKYKQIYFNHKICMKM